MKAERVSRSDRKIDFFIFRNGLGDEVVWGQADVSRWIALDPEQAWTKNVWEDSNLDMGWNALSRLRRARCGLRVGNSRSAWRPC
jgi:hypothetical protein